jgi:hypothetical protein
MIFEYNKTCFWAPYNSGLAVINVTQEGIYDLIITDGTVSWNNITTGDRYNTCPNLVENYVIYATVQSRMKIDASQDLDYYINITIQQSQPRSLFGSTISWKAMISAVVFLIILGISLAAGYYMKSGVALVVTFLVLFAIKLLLGI